MKMKMTKKKRKFKEERKNNLKGSCRLKGMNNKNKREN